MLILRQGDSFDPSETRWDGILCIPYACSGIFKWFCFKWECLGDYLFVLWEAEWLLRESLDYLSEKPAWMGIYCTTSRSFRVVLSSCLSSSSILLGAPAFLDATVTWYFWSALLNRFISETCLAELLTVLGVGEWLFSRFSKSFFVLFVFLKYLGSCSRSWSIVASYLNRFSGLVTTVETIGLVEDSSVFLFFEFCDFLSGDRLSSKYSRCFWRKFKPACYVCYYFLRALVTFSTREAV